MNARRWWGWIIVGSLPLVVTGLSSWVAYIFTEVTDLGELATMTLIIAGLVNFFGFLLFGMEGGPVFPAFRRGPRLTRAQRRQLKTERRRIALKQAIAQAEREAGIR